MKLSELIEMLKEIQEKCEEDPECFIGLCPFSYPMSEEDLFYVPESKDSKERVVIG